MADDATAVAEPTLADAPAPTEVSDAGNRAEANAAQEGAGAADATQEDSSSSEETTERIYSDGELKRELQNARQKWEKDSAGDVQAAREETIAAEHAKIARDQGKRDIVQGVWADTAKILGIDLNELRQRDPAAAASFGQALVANEAWAEFSSAESFVAEIIEKYPDIPADAVAAATAKSHSGNGNEARMDLVDAVVEHRAQALAEERTKSVSKQANERIEQEAIALEMEQGVKAPPKTPRGTGGSAITLTAFQKLSRADQRTASQKMSDAEWGAMVCGGKKG